MKVSIARALFNALNLVKNFEPGMTSRSKSQIVVDYYGDRYLITATKIEEPNKDMFKDIDKYIVDDRRN